MVNSIEWNWKEETSPIWLKPSEESFYIANHWKENDYKDVLDFGCGLGRHSIFFAKQGFNVSVDYGDGPFKLKVRPRIPQVLKQSVYIMYEMLDKIEGSDKIELQYRDEKDKKRKVTLSNKVVTKNDYVSENSNLTYVYIKYKFVNFFIRFGGKIYEKSENYCVA